MSPVVLFLVAKKLYELLGLSVCLRPFLYCWIKEKYSASRGFVKLQILGLRLGVGITFTLDNDENNDNNPLLNFFKGAILGVKEQGLGIRDQG